MSYSLPQLAIPALNVKFTKDLFEKKFYFVLHEAEIISPDFCNKKKIFPSRVGGNFQQPTEFNKFNKEI
jgi:hypothetical protein